MTDPALQQCAPTADEGWDQFLDVFAGVEHGAENDVAASSNLDRCVYNQSAPQRDCDAVASSKSGVSLASTSHDKVENRRAIQKRYREREKVSAFLNHVLSCMFPEGAKWQTLQERSRVTQGLLADAQKKLQLAENEKRLLQSRVQTFEDLMCQRKHQLPPAKPLLIAAPLPVCPSAHTVNTVDLSMWQKNSQTLVHFRCLLYLFCLI